MLAKEISKIVFSISNLLARGSFIIYVVKFLFKLDRISGIFKGKSNLTSIYRVVYSFLPFCNSLRSARPILFRHDKLSQIRFAFLVLGLTIQQLFWCLQLFPGLILLIPDAFWQFNEDMISQSHYLFVESSGYKESSCLSQPIESRKVHESHA